MTGKTMYHDGLPLTIAAFFLGPILAYFSVLPPEWVAKGLTLVISGLVTGSCGLLAQRIVRNVLKRLSTARYFPSILKDENDK